MKGADRSGRPRALARTHRGREALVAAVDAQKRPTRVHQLQPQHLRRGGHGRHAVKQQQAGSGEAREAPRTWLASTEKFAPVPCVPVLIAPAMLCSEMEPCARTSTGAGVLLPAAGGAGRGTARTRLVMARPCRDSAACRAKRRVPPRTTAVARSASTASTPCSPSSDTCAAPSRTAEHSVHAAPPRPRVLRDVP